MTLAERIAWLEDRVRYYRSRETGDTYDPFAGLRRGAERVLARLRAQSSSSPATSSGTTSSGAGSATNRETAASSARDTSGPR